MWKLFIDDERMPVDESGYIICRDVETAKTLIDKMGCPIFISFDHDLGENRQTGYDLAKYIVEKDMDWFGTFIPSAFFFYVHSQNPVGKMNIQKYLDNYLKMR